MEFTAGVYSFDKSLSAARALKLWNTHQLYTQSLFYALFKFSVPCQLMRLHSLRYLIFYLMRFGWLCTWYS
jgi:hypothetical protein